MAEKKTWQSFSQWRRRSPLPLLDLHLREAGAPTFLFTDELLSWRLPVREEFIGLCSPRKTIGGFKTATFETGPQPKAKLKLFCSNPEYLRNTPSAQVEMTFEMTQSTWVNKSAFFVGVCEVFEILSLGSVHEWLTWSFSDVCVGFLGGGSTGCFMKGTSQPVWWNLCVSSMYVRLCRPGVVWLVLSLCVCVCLCVSLWSCLASRKNSSMELAVVWGNFGCSDLAHSDLGHSDLACSDLGHFLSKFLLFSLNIHNLRTHLTHTQMEQIWPNRTFMHCFTTLFIYNWKTCLISISNFSIKNNFPTLTLAPPKYHIKIFKNIKLNATSQTLYNILYFINILLSPNICTFWDTETFIHPHSIFSALSNLTFLTSETPKFKFDKFFPCALSPTQNEPKEPKRSQINPHLDYETAVHILLKTLPIGALIWLTPIWLIEPKSRNPPQIT